MDEGGMMQEGVDQMEGGYEGQQMDEDG